MCNPGSSPGFCSGQSGLRKSRKRRLGFKRKLLIDSEFACVYAEEQREFMKGRYADPDLALAEKQREFMKDRYANPEYVR